MLDVVPPLGEISSWGHRSVGTRGGCPSRPCSGYFFGTTEPILRRPALLSATEVVDRQLKAYNDKDLDAFLACWHPDAEYYAHPHTLLAQGLEAIRARHVERFREPDLFGRLVSRATLDDRVIDHEIVTRNFPEGRGTVEVVALYEVREGRIERAWFVMGNKKLG